MSYHPSVPSRSATLPAEEDPSPLRTIIYLGPIPSAVAWPKDIYYVDSIGNLVRYVEVVGQPGYYQIPGASEVWDVSHFIRDLCNRQLFPEYEFSEHEARFGGDPDNDSVCKWPEIVLRAHEQLRRIDDVPLDLENQIGLLPNSVRIRLDSRDSSRVYNPARFIARRSDSIA